MCDNYVTEAIAQLSSVTSALYDQIADSLDALGSVASAYEEIAATSDLAEASEPASVTYSLPVYSNLAPETEEPTFDGAAPTYESQGAVTTGSVPEMTATPQEIVIPAPPSIEIPSLNATPPSITSPDLPQRPTYTLPAMPRLADLTIPDPPDYAPPEFTNDVPWMDLTPPSESFDWAESGYDSQLSAQLNGVFEADVADTNSIGISDGIVTAIYDRARGRQAADNSRAQVESTHFFSSRGFSLPSGAIASMDLEAQTRVIQTNTDQENDIAIQGAELAQSHRPFILEKSTDWVQILVRYHDEARTRALAAAKAGVEAAISVYQARVQAYQGQVEIYQSMAEAYRARIAAELSRAEFYRAQIEGSKMAIEAQRSMVKAYLAQVDGVYALTNLYRTEMEAARVNITEIDRTRLEGFAALVSAFEAEVQANITQYDLYAARIMGEEAKVELYESLVDGYNAEVDAYTETVAVQISRSKIAIEELKAQAERYKAEVERYAADVANNIGRAEVSVDWQQASAVAYDARLRLQENNANYQAKVLVTRANIAATRTTSTAQMNGSVQKANARRTAISARESAVAAKSSAREAAAELSKISTSENFSSTDGPSSTTGTRHLDTHFQYRSVTRDNVGTYTNIYR